MNISLGRPWELILILILTAFLFSSSFSQSFVSWDDEGHLTENLQVRSLTPSNIASIFRGEVNRTYIPLTILSFALEHHFFGYDPFFYHLNNLILHLGVVVLIYVIAMRLRFGHLASLLAAFLFAVHPIHVESVVWVTQRKDVLYSFFYLLAIWQYLVYLQDRKPAAYAWSLAFGCLSILAKPMALSLPLVLCLLDWYIKRPFSGRLVLEKLAFAFLIWPVAWQTYAMNMRAVDLQFPQSVLIWIWCLIFYLWKFIFPAELLVLYQLPQPISILNPEYCAALTAVMALVILLVRFKSNRIFFFAFVYFLLSVFFLLRFDNKQDLTIVADRFMYLPSLGICIWAGWAMGRVLEWSHNKKREMQRFVLGVVVLTVFVLCVLTYGRVRMWGNEALLWGQVLRRYDSGLAYTQLGNYYLKQGQLAEALRNYGSAVRRLPSYSKPYSNRGMIMLKLGRIKESLDDFSRAIELDVTPSAVTFNNRGYALMLMSEDAKALDDYNRAIAIDPKYVPAYLNRATLYKDRRDLTSAMNDLKRALAIDPQNAAAQNNVRILESLINGQ